MTDYAEFELDPGLLRGRVEVDRSLVAESEPAATVDEETFKAAMRMLASGVVMVTARIGDRLWGLTISACCSISASPPQILISLAHDASSRWAVLETGRFGLSILREGQKGLAELGAEPDVPKYVEAFFEPTGPGLHSTALAGALAHLDCAVDTVVEVSDHTLIIGTVEAAVVAPAGESGPLVHFQRRFHELGRRLP